MKVMVDEDLCTACELCTDICDDVFEMNDDVAIAKVSEVPEDLEDSVNEAAESCPADAIKISE